MDVLAFKPVSDFSAELHLLSIRAEFPKIASFITESVAKISGADRVALITFRKGGLTVEGGYPANQHGVGTRLNSETGAKFLMSVMQNAQRVLITNPSKDLRTAYLKGLAEHYGIHSILFIPLYSGEESLGVLTLDFLSSNHNFNKDYFIDLRYIARQVVTTLLARKLREEQEAEIRRLEKLAVIGTNAAHFAHAVRNKTTCVGGFAKRMLKKAGKCNKECPIHDYAEIVGKEISIVEKIVLDVLSFTKSVIVNPKRLILNQFLMEEVSGFYKSDFFKKVRFVTNFDKKLDRVQVLLDEQKLHTCLNDLFRNAVEAKASAIWLSTKVRDSFVVISVANCGERLEPSITDKLFDPFMTTRCDGTGLGLANVKSIIEAHRGIITVEPKEFGDKKNYRTEFKIYLPFGKALQ